MDAIPDLRGHDVPDHAVVLHVDESASHEAARTWAVDQAVLEGRSLVLAAMTPSAPGTAPTLQRERELAEAFLDTAADDVRHTHPDVDVRTVVMTTESVPGLVELSIRSTLMVIGAHHGGLSAIAKSLGVDAMVAARTACPVVVVPRHHPGRVRQGVLAGVDLGEHSAEVLDFAFRHASLRRLPLTVLTCVGKGQDLEEARRRLAEVTSGYGERFPDVHLTCAVRRGRPAHELVLAARAMNLLVVGRHHPIQMTRSPAGHVRSGVVDRSTCPVAVVPLATS